MKCEYCGAEIIGKGAFCRNCGTRITASKQPRVEAKPAPAQPAAPVQMAAPIQTAAPLYPADILASVNTAALPRVQPGTLPRVEELPTPIPVPVFDEKSDSWLPAEQAEGDLEFPHILPAQSPAIQLPTKRGLGKMILFGILTLGIYPLVIWSRMVTELNLAASRHDGKRTMPYFAAFYLAPVTLGIFNIVWMHKFCNRIGAELERRGIDYSFGAKTFWLWNVLGSFILVGPFIFIHKLLKSMNQINGHFNLYG